MNKVISNKSKKLLAAFLAMLIFAFNLIPLFASAEGEDSVSIKYTVSYRQTIARNMLEKINDLRAKHTVEKIGDDGQPEKDENENPVMVSANLKPLVYDYTLESKAIKRAEAIALYFNSTDAEKENILYGANTMAEAFERWSEGPAGINGKDKMVSADFGAVGVACVVFDNVFYWVQVFAAEVSDDNTEEQANNTNDVSLDAVLRKEWTEEPTLTSETESITVKYGEKADAPKFAVEYKDAASEQAKKVDYAETIDTKDSSIATIENGKVVAKGFGKTEIAASAIGASISVPVNVQKVDIADAEIAFSPAEIKYVKGQEHQSHPTIDSVKVNNKTLTSGSDYTCTVTDDTKPGTATMTFEGMGNYKGTAVRTFTIKCDHNIVKTEAIQATCSKPGKTEGSRCTICETVFQEPKDVEPLPHNFVYTKVKKAATCTEEGLEAKYCDACEQTIPTPIPALGHDWDEGTVTKQPTCTEEGEKKFSCQRSGCKETKTEVIEMVSHKFEKVYDKEEDKPTCVDDGVYHEECSVCHTKRYEGTKEDALGHDYQKKDSLSIEPTCTKDGKTVKICSRCGDKDEKPAPALNHTYADGKDAREVLKAKEATCTEDGLTEGKKCKLCGEITVKQETIKATGHEPVDFSAVEVTRKASCSQEGEAKFHCKNCDKDVVVTGIVIKDSDSNNTIDLRKVEHTAGEPIVVKPTATKDGSVTTKCEKCGEIISVVTIPKTGGTDPTTPDTPVTPDTPSSGTSLNIRNYTATKEIEYRANICLTAEYASKPAGSIVRWYKDGSPYTSGDTCTVNGVISDFTIQPKFIDATNGNVLAEGPMETIKPSGGFMVRLLSFFKALFGMTPTVNQ